MHLLPAKSPSDPLQTLNDKVSEAQQRTQNKPQHLLLSNASRWGFYSKHPLLMPYFRWVAIIIVINVWLLINEAALPTLHTSASIINSLSNMVVINFALAILIRQHYVINLLFYLATSIPTSWPLSLRWALAKVYHLGGIHSGCAIAGTVWFVILLACIGYLSATDQITFSPYLLVISAMILLLLLLMIMTAIPALRARHHNRFEITHRFAGWSLLILFWLHAVSLQAWQLEQHALIEMLAAPSFWLLALISISIILPWLRLKKVDVQHTSPSQHVTIAQFDYGVTPFVGSSIAISRNPLLEWHSFANITTPHRTGYRLAISRSGDWTAKFIDEKPHKVWVKAIPTAGVGRVDRLFRRILWVTTGSGIGPCLPHLLADTVPSHLLWSTKDPTKTYGSAFVNEILNTTSDAVIWDTSLKGKPNMVELTYQAFCNTGAEAIICIANKKLTYQVVHAMESRGIPAFGAIWDS